MTSSEPYYLPEVPSPNTIHWKLGLQPVNFGETHSVSNYQKVYSKYNSSTEDLQIITAKNLNGFEPGTWTC